ncbi:MAG: metallophosphoesterase family protein [Candidatus Riflebacteria bacterium]|nr:metallophosphoesterase family protein [Candidatus Riflebacteria bacterium]
MKIGIISDTHSIRAGGYEIPEWVREAFQDTDLIIHAGDVESPEVLEALKEIAPVYAVRGNCDSYYLKTPTHISVNIGVGLLTVAHKPATARDAVEPDTKVLVYGHTHISTISEEDGLLVINPGSPTFPRGGLPASVAVLIIEKGQLFPQIISR